MCHGCKVLSTVLELSCALADPLELLSQTKQNKICLAWQHVSSNEDEDSVLPRVFLHAQEVCPLLVKLLLRFPEKIYPTMLRTEAKTSLMGNNHIGFDSPLLFCTWPLFHQLFLFWVVHRWMHRRTVFPYLFSCLQKKL